MLLRNDVAGTVEQKLTILKRPLATTISDMLTYENIKLAFVIVREANGNSKFLSVVEVAGKPRKSS